MVWYDMVWYDIYICIIFLYSLAGRLDFNPLSDEMRGEDGVSFTLSPPNGMELPSKGFDKGDTAIFQSPPQDGYEI